MSDDGFHPVRILEIDLSAPLPPVDRGPEGRHRRALVLVRLHAVALGLLDVALPPGGLDPAGLARAAWAEVADSAAAHLREDGLPVPDALGPEGLPSEETPACARAREEFLRDAPFLSVLIPSRERPERLGRCLDSILASEYPRERYEVVVVDNRPVTDGTRQLIEKYAGRGPVRYAREDASGSASARNRGLEVVRGELVVMTDDDVLVDPLWLTEVARAFHRHPEATCVSGLLLPLELETQAQLWFEEYGGFSRGFEPRVYDLSDHRLADDPLYPYDAGVFGTGNNFSFRRTDLLEIGAFDPALGNGTPALGGVDSEVLLRTILRGKTIVYEPRALVWHAHRPGYDALRRQVYAYGAGLVAYQLKLLLEDPLRRVPEIARRLPAAARFALSSSSGKNAGKQTDYPDELTRLELRGMRYGPRAYVRSRRACGPHRTRP